jgi:DNA helicase-2/ATP-dependent DNA helicase PcrA
VGDDDQSIYRFRGANIQNILNFEQEYMDAKVIKLEQNYRSTENILNVANAVISHNTGRKDKTLWTDNGKGEKLEFRKFNNSFEEADFVAGDIRRQVRDGHAGYQDFAVLYRTNAQSRMFEEKFVAANIPYKIVGGVNFYSRREIKDLLAYLKTIDNGRDDLAVRRIINVPKRGIGLTTINRVQEYAAEHEISFYEALRVADLIPGVGRALTKLDSFVALIEHLKDELEYISLSELLTRVIEMTGYVDLLKEEGTDEAEARIENVDELLSKIADYEESCEETPTLSGFLEEVALVADVDSLEEDQDYVVLMTLHSAKGLEFPQVYLAGMEDGLFPGYMSISADDRAELEEERRLCYVGITRAQKRLTLTCARQRMIRGEVQYNAVSRFVKEIPDSLFGGKELFAGEKEPEMPKQTAYIKAKQSFKAQPFAGGRPVKQFAVKPGQALEYGVGDTVRHMKFGTGIVTAINEGGRDFEVTVDFDTVGTKKMFAAFAKLTKV